MHIDHILLYRFRPGVDRTDEHLAAIRSFEGKVPGLLRLNAGRSLAGGFNGGFTHGFVMTFESAAHLQAYNKSPEHNELVAAFKQDIEEKLVFDLTRDR
jgi:quinol monooxygenase YgiN